MADVATDVNRSEQAEAAAIVAELKMLADRFQIRQAQFDRLTDETQRIGRSIDARLDSIDAQLRRLRGAA